MSDADRAQDQRTDRQVRDAERADRAERLRELVRLDLRAFHGGAEHLEMSTGQLKNVIDSGDPSATTIHAICDCYGISANVVLYGSDSYDVDALALSLDAIMCTVLSETIPSGRRISYNPSRETGLSLTARSRYAETMAYHVALSAGANYEKLELSARTHRLKDRGEPFQTDAEYPDPWATSAADEPPPDNVSRLISRKDRHRTSKPL